MASLMAVLHLYIPDEMYERLVRLAENLGVKPSELARRAVLSLVEAEGGGTGGGDAGAGVAAAGGHRASHVCEKLVEALLYLARANLHLARELAVRKGGGGSEGQ